MIKNIYFFLFILFIGCQNEERVCKNIIPFKCDTTISSITGVAKDSLYSYFPRFLFYDTFRYGSYKDSAFEYHLAYEIENVKRDNNFDEKYLKVLDSIKIEEQSYPINYWSSTLFAMNEPVLSNCFLNKEIYRFSINMTFRPFVSISFTKNNDSVYVDTKILSKKIPYSLLKIENKLATENYIYENEETEHENELFPLKKRYDSIIKSFIKADKFICLHIHKRTTKKQWNELISKLDKINFWQRHPDGHIYYIQIDGGNCFLEGHCKSGYQYLEHWEDNGQNLVKYMSELSCLNYEKFFE